MTTQRKIRNIDRLFNVRNYDLILEDSSSIDFTKSPTFKTSERIMEKGVVNSSLLNDMDTDSLLEIMMVFINKVENRDILDILMKEFLNLDFDKETVRELYIAYIRYYPFELGEVEGFDTLVEISKLLTSDITKISRLGKKLKLSKLLTNENLLRSGDPIYERIFSKKSENSSRYATKNFVEFMRYVTMVYPKALYFDIAHPAQELIVFFKNHENFPNINIEMEKNILTAMHDVCDRFQGLKLKNMYVVSPKNFPVLRRENLNLISRIIKLNLNALHALYSDRKNKQQYETYRDKVIETFEYIYMYSIELTKEEEKMLKMILKRSKIYASCENVYVSFIKAKWHFTKLDKLVYKLSRKNYQKTHRKNIWSLIFKNKKRK